MYIYIFVGINYGVKCSWLLFVVEENKCGRCPSKSCSKSVTYGWGERLTFRGVGVGTFPVGSP